MNDTITQIGKGTLVQHGKHNDRVYLLKVIDDDLDILVDELNELAEKYHYSKICCKIPKRVSPLFAASGYLLEGYIPGFYKGKEDAFFVSKFIDKNRMNNVPSAFLKDLYSYTSVQRAETTTIERPEGYSFRKLNSNDIPAMVEVYTQVFSSYPFPIHDPAYIQRTMEADVLYFGAFRQGYLTAVASSEMDRTAKNVEMTDFATRAAHTGHKLAYHLLRLMEEEMKLLGMITFYTIARLKSIPMNKTFLQMGYEFSGTLLNNTHIAGEIETMILYYKKVGKDEGSF